MEERFYEIDELRTIQEQNRKALLNCEERTQTKKRSSPARKTSELSDFERRIIDLTKLQTDSNGGASPREIFYELERNYPGEYDAKKVSDKMWALDKKGLLKKKRTGWYASVDNA